VCAETVALVNSITIEGYHLTYDDDQNHNQVSGLTGQRRMRSAVMAETQKVVAVMNELWGAALTETELELQRCIEFFPLETDKDMEVIFNVIASYQHDVREFNKVDEDRQRRFLGIDAEANAPPTACAPPPGHQVREAVFAAQQRIADLNGQVARAKLFINLSRGRYMRHRAGMKYIQMTLLKEISALHRKIDELLGENVDGNEKSQSFFADRVYSLLDFINFFTSTIEEPDERSMKNLDQLLVKNMKPLFPGLLDESVDPTATAPGFFQVAEVAAQRHGTDPKFLDTILLRWKHEMLSPQCQRQSVSAELPGDELREFVSPARSDGYSALLSEKCQRYEEQLDETARKFKEQMENALNRRRKLEKENIALMRELRDTRSTMEELRSYTKRKDVEVEEAKQRYEKLSAEVELERIVNYSDLKTKFAELEALEKRIDLEKRKLNRLLSRMAEGNFSTDEMDLDTNDSLVFDYLRSAAEVQRIQDEVIVLKDENHQLDVQVTKMEENYRELTEIAVRMYKQMRQEQVTPDPKVRQFISEHFPHMQHTHLEEQLFQKAKEREEQAHDFSLLTAALEPFMEQMQGALHDIHDTMDSVDGEVRDTARKKSIVETLRGLKDHSSRQRFTEDLARNLSSFDAAWHGAVIDKSFVEKTFVLRPLSTQPSSSRPEAALDGGANSIHSSSEEQPPAAATPFSEKVRTMIEDIPRLLHVLQALAYRSGERDQFNKSAAMKLRDELRTARQQYSDIKVQMDMMQRAIRKASLSSSTSSPTVERACEGSARFAGFADTRGSTNEVAREPPQGVFDQNSFRFLELDPNVDAETQTAPPLLIDAAVQSRMQRSDTAASSERSSQCLLLQDYKPPLSEEAQTQTDALAISVEASVQLSPVVSPHYAKAPSQDTTRSFSDVLSIADVAEKYLGVIHSTTRAVGLTAAGARSPELLNMPPSQGVESLATRSLVPALYERRICGQCGSSLRPVDTIPIDLKEVATQTVDAAASRPSTGQRNRTVSIMDTKDDGVQTDVLDDAPLIKKQSEEIEMKKNEIEEQHRFDRSRPGSAGSAGRAVPVDRMVNDDGVNWTAESPPAPTESLLPSEQRGEVKHSAISRRMSATSAARRRYGGVLLGVPIATLRQQHQAPLHSLKAGEWTFAPRGSEIAPGMSADPNELGNESRRTPHVQRSLSPPPPMFHHHLPARGAVTIPPASGPLRPSSAIPESLQGATSDPLVMQFIHDVFVEEFHVPLSVFHQTRKSVSQLAATIHGRPPSPHAMRVSEPHYERISSALKRGMTTISRAQSMETSRSRGNSATQQRSLPN
jgi:hypothetical protein